MTLYEIQSMVNSLNAMSGPDVLTPEEVEAQGDRLRELFKNDPQVRL